MKSSPPSVPEAGVRYIGLGMGAWGAMLPSKCCPRHFLAMDGKAYAYNYNRVLSSLYLVDGLK